MTYTKAVYLIEFDKNIGENGFLMLKEDKNYGSPPPPPPQLPPLFYEVL